MNRKFYDKKKSFFYVAKEEILINGTKFFNRCNGKNVLDTMAFVDGREVSRNYSIDLNERRKKRN